MILRGINEMITFISPGTGILPSGANVFSEIAKTKANSVRLYWQMSDTKSDTPAEIDVALTNAEQQKLIPIIYVFQYSPTDPNSSYTTTTVSAAAAFWSKADMVSVIQKHSQWLIIALREKNLPTTESLSDWATHYTAVFAGIRKAGINVPLAIDAPNYGLSLDIDTLQSVVPTMIAADPNHNLLLSVNAWSANFTPDMITMELSKAQQAAVPLVIGEFSGYEQPGCPNTPFGYETLLAQAQATGTGWLAWSWGGATNFNCQGGYLDMTSDGTFASLRQPGWGYNVAVADPNSIQNTAVPSSYTPGSACPATN